MFSRLLLFLHILFISLLVLLLIDQIYVVCYDFVVEFDVIHTKFIFVDCENLYNWFVGSKY